MEIDIAGIKLELLPEKGIYIDSLRTLLVSDVHLGKSETFQSLGIPIPNTINQTTLNRLQTLCADLQPETLFILGDLFHSKFALVDEVLNSWFKFLNTAKTDVSLIVGNHDRSLTTTLEKLSIHCFTDAIQIGNLVLSHEPCPNRQYFNICGHIHPCIRIRDNLDNLRLPCFYLENADNLLILPSFGEFTGGYEMPLTPNSTAYVIAEDTVIPFGD
ncbi:MAG: ligase-associated DNA damage response endonuclease PdeM [Cyanothece sp. SIO1E1]|nr:ligase-associated DNA damage response endonuclease PdeM [Cyanothece sp. SIO1E1]